VQRQADAALFDALSSGRFCYVLNSRQMGKSSLCVRTMARLQAAGARTAFVDLTKIGGRNVTPDQWYAGLVVEVGRALGLRSEMLKNWQEEQALSPMQRFFSALRDVALQTIDSQIVIFVDEIDATRSLSFSANEFFAGIRECYNRRVHDAAYSRLTFCLLGVAVPGDLVADPTTTPFNIGERVVLADFTPEEAEGLLQGFGAGAQDVLHRILYWTHGHPFLTQSLASTAVSRGDVKSSADVDRLVADLLFQAKSRETNINLADVGNRILAGAPDPAQVAKYRADVLSLYEKILKGQPVFDDESNKLAAVLKLSGIVRVEERLLKVRNRIYERVFDKTWIKENMPGAELRRQRRAFIKGAVRTGLVAAAIVAVIAWLAVKATRERDRANYEVYVATMNLMRPMWEQNNIERMIDLLESTKESPSRGWEWDYWKRMTHLETTLLPKRLVTAFGTRYTPDGKLYVVEDGHIWEYVPDTGKLVDVMPAMGQDSETLTPFPDGKRLLEYNGGDTSRVIDIANRRALATLADNNWWNLSDLISPDGRWVIGGHATEFDNSNICEKTAVVWEVETGIATSLPTPCMRSAAFSPDGQRVAIVEVDLSRGTQDYHVVLRQVGTWKVLATFETNGSTAVVRFSPSGDRLATSTATGWVHLWDMKTNREIAHTQVTSVNVFYLEFSRDGQWLAANGSDRLGRLYDVSGSHMLLLNTFRDAGFISIAPDKSRVAVSYSTLRLYDPKAYVETPTAASGLDNNGELQVLPSGVARVRSGEKFYELEPRTGRKTDVSGLPGKPIFQPESGERWGAVALDSGRIQIVDFPTAKPLLTLPDDGRTLLAVREFHDDRRVVLFYSDKTFDVWDVLAQKLLKREHTPLYGVAKVSPDGRCLAISYWGKDVSLWDTTSWTERPLQRKAGFPQNITYSADSTRLLAPTVNDDVEIWDVRSAALVGKLTGHSSSVDDASFSPDGTRIVTSSDDRTVRIWDAKTLRELTSFAGHEGGVFRARFTADGRSVISIDRKGVAKLWTTTAK
jgi:WD40 repeat protein